MQMHFKNRSLNDGTTLSNLNFCHSIFVEISGLSFLDILQNIQANTTKLHLVCDA